MNSKRSRSNKGYKPKSRNNGQQYVTKKQMMGGKFTPPTNPPDVTYIPWNPVTLVLTFTGQLTLTVNDVKRYIRKQLDPTGRGFNPLDSGDARFVIQFRIHRIQSWNLTGRVISMSVQDFIDASTSSGGRDQLCGLVDTGTSTHTPAVGYQLPASHFHHVLRTDDKLSREEIVYISSPATDQCIAYISMLYRFDGPAQHPSVLSPIGEIQRTLNKVSNKILNSKESSKVELVMNGIKYVAEAVAVIAADSCSGDDAIPVNDATNRVSDEDELCESLVRRVNVQSESFGSDSWCADAIQYLA